MKLSSLGEFGLIRKIRKLSSRTSPLTVIGIGDDAAALRISPASLLLATTDMLVEGIHFNLSTTDLYSLGWKSVAVNLSDIAAMGGVPRFCLTSLSIPSSVPAEQILDFYRGFNALAKTHHAALVGGDTCASGNGLIISVTILGETNRKWLITRSGAKPGDRIFVTGTLGDSAAGMELLQAGSRSQKSEVRSQKVAASFISREEKRLIQKHLRPEPRVEWGKKIAQARCASAMIDISDGLSSDLGHICEQSKAGAIVHSGKVPLSAALLKAKERLKHAPLQYALSGGEDYELLFTVPPSGMKRFAALNIPAMEIGTITRGRKLLIIDEDGEKKPLKPTGYDHFAR
jgi:thiamine-monophosphate kinase